MRRLPHRCPGKPRMDDRKVIPGKLHVLKTGCRWRGVPAAYCPPTICNRDIRFARAWQLAEIVRKGGGIRTSPRRVVDRSSHVTRSTAALGSACLLVLSAPGNPPDFVPAFVSPPRFQSSGHAAVRFSAIPEQSICPKRSDRNRRSPAPVAETCRSAPGTLASSVAPTAFRSWRCRRRLPVAGPARAIS